MGKVKYSELTSFLLDIVFPRRVDISFLESEDADKLIKKIPKAKENKLPYIDSCFEYRHPLTKKIVWQIKYHKNKTLAEKIVPYLHDILLEAMSEDALLYNSQKPILVPIPMSKERKKKRGFNQALLIAEKLHKYDPSIYREILDTLDYKSNHVSQTTIKNREERLQNMRNRLFVRKPERIKGESVIIVDDVSTTGATIKEARRALKEAGAKNVRAITIAH